MLRFHLNSEEVLSRLQKPVNAGKAAEGELSALLVGIETNTATVEISMAMLQSTAQRDTVDMLFWGIHQEN